MTITDSSEAGRLRHFDLTPEEILGVNSNDEMVARYDQLREAAAGNVLSLLTAESEEFVRKQGEVNWRFLESVGLSLPRATIDPQIDSWKSMSLDDDIFCKAHIREVNPVFEINPSRNGEELGQNLVDLIGIRAAVIWFEQDVDDAYRLFNSGYGKAKIKQGTTVVPYVIAGHRTRPSEKYTELFMLPLIIEDDIGSRFNRPGVTLTYSGSNTDNSLPGHARIAARRHMLRAIMPLGQYSQLIATQDALMSTPLSQGEVEKIHKRSSGKLELGHNGIPVVRAEESSKLLLPLRNAPDNLDELGREEFDIHVVGTVAGTITPQEFLSFNVSDDLHRAAAMMGRLAAFDSARSRLLADTLKDPEIEILNKR